MNTTTDPAPKSSLPLGKAPNIGVEATIWPYMCETCGRICLHQYALDEHVDAHYRSIRRERP